VLYHIINRKVSFLSRKFGKNIVLIPSNIVSNIERICFLLFVKVDNICHNIAHHIETTITIIHLVGSLFITSTHISNIFCQTAVEIARSTHIGIKNRKYFFIAQIIFGIFLVIALCKVCFLKLLS